MAFLKKTALTNSIHKLAGELGFFKCGIAEARLLQEDKVRLEKWLNAGRHGDMQYMENHFEKRTQPKLLVEGAKSIIVLLFNYTPHEKLGTENSLKISNYAYGKDYHDVIRQKMRPIVTLLQQHHPDSTARGFVDSAPVLERAWAEKAGLGWIGKNTCLITPEAGSYFFLSEIVTDVELQYDQGSVPDHCKGCARCLKACPTEALDDRGLDSRKCISYLTIEYRRENLPEEFRDKMKNWIFGCDICQEVCPWNRLAEPHSETEFLPSTELKSLQTQDWKNLDEKHFHHLFRKSAIKRTKFKGLKRNIAFITGKD
jgi:epoxyqueuosine reductase